MTTPKRVPVTMRALLQRINRRLEADGDKVLKVARSARARQYLGNYYIIDVTKNAIAGIGIKPEDYAMRLGVLAEWEEIV